MSKEDLIHIRITRAEKRELQRAAGSRGLSRFMREAALSTARATAGHRAMLERDWTNRVA